MLRRRREIERESPKPGDYVMNTNSINTDNVCMWKRCLRKRTLALGKVNKYYVNAAGWANEFRTEQAAATCKDVWGRLVCVLTHPWGCCAASALCCRPTGRPDRFAWAEWRRWNCAACGDRRPTCNMTTFLAKQPLYRVTHFHSF